MKRFIFLMLFLAVGTNYFATAEVDTLWLRLCDYDIKDLLFTADSKQIITCGESNNIYFWDVQKGEVVRTLNNGGSSYSLQLFNNGKYLLTNTLNNEKPTAPKIWDLETGTVIKEMNTKIPYLCKSVISNDGKYIVSSCYEYGVFVHDTSTGDTIKSFDFSHYDSKYGWQNDAVYNICISPDSKYLLFPVLYSTSSSKNSLKIINLSTMEIENSIEIPGGQHLCFSHDGKYFFIDLNIDDAYQTRHEVLMYDFSTKSIVKSFINDTYGAIYNFSVSEDDKYLVTGNDGNDLNLFDIEKGTKIYSYNNGRGWGTYLFVDITSDNSYICGSGSESMYLFPFKTTSVIDNSGNNNTSIIQSILFDTSRNNLNITLNLTKSSNTEISLIDIKGTVVSTLFNDYLEAGQQTLSFDLGNISSGTYIINVISGEVNSSTTISVVR